MGCQRTLGNSDPLNSLHCVTHTETHSQLQPGAPSEKTDAFYDPIKTVSFSGSSQTQEQNE